MINPYTLLGALLVWAATLGGAFWYGTHIEADHKDAVQARERAIGDTAAARAADAAASAIAGIRVVNTTIQARVQHEIETHTVYRDCEHTPDGLRLVNDALRNVKQTSELAGGGLLPRADAASGPQLRLDLHQAR
jgi:hypothetical protein